MFAAAAAAASVFRPDLIYTVLMSVALTPLQWLAHPCFFKLLPNNFTQVCKATEDL